MIIVDVFYKNDFDIIELIVSTNVIKTTDPLQISFNIEHQNSNTILKRYSKRSTYNWFLIIAFICGGFVVVFSAITIIMYQVSDFISNLLNVFIKNFNFSDY